MFFRETRETEEYIRRMFCEAREKMRKMITLKKKSDLGSSAQLANQPVVPNAHKSSCPLQPYSSQEATDDLQKN
ncbi:hypothetical protein DY000_02021862 [Brassica cretica]|uniref:Uncharacterized protein n=1 Tax=Brassica cretica TaxID=69181 RepID=A0ABQ7E4B8_BRACR|nr:hypothetical protein DY000_02021862 [Brassica cretica]